MPSRLRRSNFFALSSLHQSAAVTYYSWSVPRPLSIVSVPVHQTQVGRAPWRRITQTLSFQVTIYATGIQQRWQHPSPFNHHHHHHHHHCYCIRMQQPLLPGRACPNGVPTRRPRVASGGWWTPGDGHAWSVKTGVQFTKGQNKILRPSLSFSFSFLFVVGGGRLLILGKVGDVDGTAPPLKIWSLLSAALRWQSRGITHWAQRLCMRFCCCPPPNPHLLFLYANLRLVFGVVISKIG